MLHARRHFRTALVCLCCLALDSTAAPHDSEPINTEFASPLAPRTANLNFDLQHFDGNPSDTFVLLGLEYGVARRMQLGADLPVVRRVTVDGRSATGVGNLSLSYRYLLAGGNERPFAVSINPQAELPTGNASVAERAYTAGASLHVDAHRGEKLWLHSNFGYQTAVAHFVEKSKDFDFAVAGMYELAERWHPVIEVFGHHDFTGAVTELSVAPEVIYSAAKHWELKLAVPIGTTSSTPNIGVQFRVTWKIGAPKRQ